MTDKCRYCGGWNANMVLHEENCAMKDELAGENPLTQAELDAIPPKIGSTTLSDNFGDIETLFNSRDWLRAALEDKGAKVIGGGLGMGQADLDIELEGCQFAVSIKPKVKL